MHRILSIMNYSYERLLIILNYISVIGIFLMAAWVFADVVGRYVFNHPIPGTTELVKCAIIAIVFLGVAYGLQQKRHVRTVLIVDRLPPLAQAMCGIVAALLAIAVFTLLSIYSFKAGLDSWHAREFEGVLVKIPIYPSRFMVVIGSSLLVVQSILDLITQLRLLKKA